MQKHTVHIYATMRFQVDDVEAENQAAAAKIADDLFDLHDLEGVRGNMEPTDEVTAYLVDVDGDTEHLESKLLGPDFQLLHDTPTGRAPGKPPEPESLYNAECPYCGKSELVGIHSSINSEIPLNVDGFDSDEGNPVTGELFDVTCQACMKDVPVYHYFGHGEETGEECDCKPSQDNDDDDAVKRATLADAESASGEELAAASEILDKQTDESA